MKLIRVGGKMNGGKYHEILILQSAKDFRLSQRFTFQQENESKYTTRAAKEWFQSKT